jgi:hypothetical protein
MVKRPVNGFRWLGTFMLSSENVSVEPARLVEHTVVVVILAYDVHVLVALKRLFQKLDLLVAFDASSFGLLPVLTITLHLVELHHLVDSFFVLLLHAEFELELRQHELDSGPEMWRVVFDKV